MKKIILFIFIIGWMLYFDIQANNAQDLSAVLSKTRLEGVFNRNVNINDESLNGFYMLSGKATGSRIILDSISITQHISIDISFQSSFSLFGQLQVSVLKYNKDAIVLNPDDPKVATITLLNGLHIKNYSNWILIINEISKSGTIRNIDLTAILKFPNPKELKAGQIIDGPYGLKLKAKVTPPYTQLELSAHKNALIKTPDGNLIIPNAVWRGRIIRDDAAIHNPYFTNGGVDFYVVNGGYTTPFSDFVMDTYSTTIYTRDSAAIANDGYYFVYDNAAVKICSPDSDWAPGNSLFINSGFKPRAKDPTLQRNLWTNGKDSLIYLACKMKLDTSKRYIVSSGVFTKILVNPKTNSEIKLDSNLFYQKSQFDNFITSLNSKGDTILISSALRDSNCIDAVWFRDSYTKDSVSSTVDYKAETLEIYPNPAQDYITIFNKFADKFKPSYESEILIYNTLGEIVYQVGTKDEILVRLDISNFPKGIYFVISGGEFLKFVKI